MTLKRPYRSWQHTLFRSHGVVISCRKSSSEGPMKPSPTIFIIYLWQEKVAEPLKYIHKTNLGMPCLRNSKYFLQVHKTKNLRVRSFFPMSSTSCRGHKHVLIQGVNNANYGILYLVWSISCHSLYLSVSYLLSNSFLLCSICL